MKKFHPFYYIGTVGMIVSATWHMILTMVLSLSSVHQSFYVIYPTFLAFTIMGVALTIRDKTA